MDFSLLFAAIIPKKITHRLVEKRRMVSLSIFADSEEELTITVAIDDAGETVNINDIHIYTYKGHGLSYVLLYLMLKFVLEKYPGLKTITLDDMTDKYRIVGENLYMKLGMEYVEESGPEMVGKLKLVMEKCWRQIFK